MDENLYLNVICTFLFGMSFGSSCFFSNPSFLLYCQPTWPSSLPSSLHSFLPPSFLPSIYIYMYKWAEIQHCHYFVAKIILSLAIGRVKRLTAYKLVHEGIHTHTCTCMHVHTHTHKCIHAHTTIFLPYVWIYTEILMPIQDHKGQDYSKALIWLYLFLLFWQLFSLRGTSLVCIISNVFFWFDFHIHIK